jgi:hypothetical protein
MDSHYVLARLDGGELVRLAGPLEWSAAQELWHVLDERRVRYPAQRSYGSRPYPVRHYMVRSGADPEVAAATRLRLPVDRERAARKWAAAHGYVGRAGGWIYAPGGQPVCQGWAVFAGLLQRQDKIRALAPRAWWWNGLELEAAAAAGAAR